MRGETHPIYAKMTRNTNILNELNELNSSLVNVNTQNVYTVPVGYFDGLTVIVLNRIKAMNAENAVEELSYLSPILSNISKQTPYTVPAGYFDSLAETALHSVREGSDYQTAKEEIETLSPLLSGLKKQIPYSVPQGYFDDIAEKTAKPVVKVVSITHRSWFKYAAAAVVIGIIALSGILIFGKNPTGEKSLAKFEKKLNKEIKKMSDSELKDFIEYSDAGLNGEEKVSTNPSDEIKELLKDLPESELKEFLEETSDLNTETTLMN